MVREVGKQKRVFRNLLFCRLYPGVSGRRRLQDGFLQDKPAWLRHLHEEVVVADEAEENAVAVDAIVSHHFLHGYLTGTGALVDDVLDEVLTASHNYIKP